MFDIVLKDGLTNQYFDCLMTVLNADSAKSALEIAMTQRPEIFGGNKIHSTKKNASVIGSIFGMWVYAVPTIIQ